MIPFINCFEVPADSEETFLSLWREVNAYMVVKPGYISHQLHRSLTPDARFRFINFALWESPEHWSAAHDDGFRALLANPEWRPFTTIPALYEVVHAGSAPSA